MNDCFSLFQLPCQHAQHFRRIHPGIQQVAAEADFRAFTALPGQRNRHFRYIYAQRSRCLCLIQPGGNTGYGLKGDRRFKSQCFRTFLLFGFPAFSLTVQPFDDAVQLQLRQCRNAFSQIRQDTGAEGEFHRRVPADCCQLLAEAGLVRISRQLFTQLALHLIRVFQHLFQGAVFLQQFYRGLVADARHTGNIVAGVPRQAFPVRHLFRGKTVFFIYF